MTLVLVIGLVGAGAFAYFDDTETSENNVFTAGTLDLQIDSNPDGAVFTWVDDPDVPTLNCCFGAALDCLKPGDEATVIVGIRNNGCVDGTADIHIKNVVDDDNGLEEPEPATGYDGDLSRAVNVVISYGDKSAIGDTGNWAHCRTGTLLGLDCKTIDAPVPLPSKGTADADTDYWVIEFWIPGTVGNEIMGDTVTFDIEFTLHQVPS